jgi:hypothetical protein
MTTSGGMRGKQRCDEIVRLIDDALREPDINHARLQVDPKVGKSELRLPHRARPGDTVRPIPGRARSLLEQASPHVPGEGTA